MRVQDRKEVTLKHLAESHPNDAMLACFRSEFETLKRVAIPAVIEVLNLLDHDSNSQFEKFRRIQGAGYACRGTP